MAKDPYFISCDWGTTNFRLRLVLRDSLEIVHETRTDQGVKRMYESFRQQRGVSQEDFYRQYLARQLAKLPSGHQEHLVAIAGMASSNIGMRDLPYANIPFSMSGQGLVWESICHMDQPQILLISGVKSNTGLVRGEETQAIGLTGELSGYPEGILLLPGTHCKHFTFKDNLFVSLKNYMTGELFDILSRNSILANSVAPGPFDDGRKPAFQEGVHRGLQDGLSSSLLTLRARDVLENYSRENGYYFLSGLLIGDELAYLQHQDKFVFLGAPATTYPLYKTALEMIFPGDQVTPIESASIDRAVLAGQKKILEMHEK